MKQDGWNKYWIFSLTKSELSRIVLYDARHETPLVINMTRQALDTSPKLTRAELETAEALDEDIL